MIPDTPVQEEVCPRAGIRALTVARQRWNHTSFPHDVGVQERYAHRHDNAATRNKGCQSVQ